MNPSLVGRIIGLAFLSGARPFLTIALAQAAVMVGVYAGWVTLHPDYALVLSWPVIGVVLGLAVVELVVAHDEHADEFKRVTHLDKVAGVIATAYGTVLMFAIGEPVPAAISSTAPPEVTSLIQHVTGEAPPVNIQAATVVGAASFNLGLTWLRGRILDWLTHVGLSGVWNVIETGGVALAAAIVLFAPVLMLVFIVIASALVAMLAIGARVWQRHADQIARIPCPRCGRTVRVEASLCPQCRSPLAPSKWLGQEQLVPPAANRVAFRTG